MFKNLAIRIGLGVLGTAAALTWWTLHPGPSAEHPKAGDWLKWRVPFNGQVVKEEKEVLDKDLEPNTAFFLQSYFDDYSKALDEMKGYSREPSSSSDSN